MKPWPDWLISTILVIAYAVGATLVTHHGVLLAGLRAWGILR